MVNFNINSFTQSLLVAMLFYSTVITSLTYAMPSDMLHYTTIFSESENTINLNETTTKLEGAVQQQTSIPVIEMGALVFYSGNILLDFILNFLYALPQIVTMFLNGFFMIFQIDTVIASILQIAISSILTILYLLGLITMLIGIRSGNTSGFT